MTDSGQEHPENSRDTSEDETTHIARRDATRPLPTQSEEPVRHSSWSGSAGGSSPVSSGSSPQGPTGAGSSPAGSSQYAGGQQIPAAEGGRSPAQGHYPSAPPQGGPQGPSGPGYAGPGASSPQGGWSAPPQGYPQSNSPYGGQYGAPGPNAYGPPQGYPQQPYGYGGQAGYQGQPYQQQYGSAQPFTGPAYQGQPANQPYGAQQYGQGPYGARPQPGNAYPGSSYGPYAAAPNTSAKNKAVKHELTPMEKFGPLMPAFLILIAALLTWMTFKSGPHAVSLNGVGGNSNGSDPHLGGAKSTGGWLTIVIALGLAGLATAAILGKLKGTLSAVVTIVLSALALVVGLIQFANVSSIVNSDAGKGYSGTIGIGVWLTLFGALVGLVLGVMALLTARKRESGRSAA